MTDKTDALLAQLDDYLQGCPDPNKVWPKWMVRKASRLLWACREALAAQPAGDAHYVAEGRGHWQIAVEGKPYNFRNPPGFKLVPDTTPPAASVDVEGLLPKLRDLLERINRDTVGDDYLNISCDALDLIDSAGGANGMRDAYEGAREDLLDWKGRAQRAYGNDMHQQLCKLGEKWLRRQGCRVTLCDPFKAAVCTGECPDVIGWRDGHSVLIECKVSRSDFLADKSKKFRADPALGMGDARLYLAPPGVIQPDDLPEGWGLLIAEGDRVSIASDYPRSYEMGCWSSKPRPKGYRKRIGINWRPLPFTGNKQCETVMLVSALARGMGANTQ